MLWNFLIPGDSEVTVCLFKHATGFACPSCGSTRSVLSILHGDFGTALFLNPLGYLGVLIMVVVPILGISGRLNGSHLFTKTMRIVEVLLRKPRIALPLVGLVLMNWVWNIYKGL